MRAPPARAVWYGDRVLKADRYGLCGSVIERRYRVGQPLAEGGFALVYGGHHLTLDVPVALKVLRPLADPLAAAEMVGRFLDEAKTVARLRHPHIVAVLDAGVLTHTPAPLPWMALEWVPGQTLGAWLATRGRLTPAEAVDLALPLLDALGFAHRHHVAHRDVKPANVMVSPAGTSPRLLDFGIAKILCGDETPGSGATHTLGGPLVFSPQFAAPEQIAGTRTGPWTDLHAIGLLLTHLTTGQLPYPGAEREDILAHALDLRRPTPARFGLDVGPLEAVIARSLALRPRDRFASCEQLREALVAAVR